MVTLEIDVYCFFHIFHGYIGNWRLLFFLVFSNICFEFLFAYLYSATEAQIGFCDCYKNTVYLALIPYDKPVNVWPVVQ